MTNSCACTCVKQDKKWINLLKWGCHIKGWKSRTEPDKLQKQKTQRVAYSTPLDTQGYYLSLSCISFISLPYFLSWYFKIWIHIQYQNTIPYIPCRTDPVSEDVKLYGFFWVIFLLAYFYLPFIFYSAIFKTLKMKTAVCKQCCTLKRNQKYELKPHYHHQISMTIRN